MSSYWKYAITKTLYNYRDKEWIEYSLSKIFYNNNEIKAIVPLDLTELLSKGELIKSDTEIKEKIIENLKLVLKNIEDGSVITIS